MIIYYLPLLISVLFVIINADGNKDKNSAINIPVAERQPNDILVKDSLDQSWQTTTEKTLIRVPRLDDDPEKLSIIDRERRQLYDTDEIWGMARKVAITVFVLVSLCIVCCITTTVFICVKCCCGGNNRKRNQGFTTVPQPIIIHTNSPNYQPQFQHQQQQAPPPTQTWMSENHPMLPQPSAPPLPNDDFYMERPPPYEKVCAGP